MNTKIKFKAHRSPKLDLPGFMADGPFSFWGIKMEQEQEYCELGEHFVEREDVEIQIDGAIACKDCIKLLGGALRKPFKEEFSNGR
jgi:hypothetical protein